MRKILYIIVREYVSRVRTKSFLLTTLGTPLLFLLFPIIAVWLANSGNSSIQIVAVNDESGLFADVPFPDKEDGSIYFEAVQAIHTDSLLTQYDAVLVIPQDFNLKNVARSPVTFISKKRTGIATRSYINETIRNSVRKLQFAELNIQTQETDLEIPAVINYERQNAGDDKSAFIGIASVA